MQVPSFFQPFIQSQGFLMLDGGLATELEKQGHNLDHPLWSARLLATNPQAIRDVHHAYLDAGADCLITASYQASVPGLVAQGLSDQEAKATLAQSVTLACEARDGFLKETTNNETSRMRPIVAASVGPYGAFLADGSEYRGDYSISDRDLHDFHAQRWHGLCDSRADLLACETIPSLQEAKILRTLLRERPDARAWISFCCKDAHHISDGTPLVACASLFKENEQVVAIGINCTAPRFVSSLIEQVKMGAPTKAIVVYPNSGEVYDTQSRSWTGMSDPQELGEAAVEWFQRGATLIGGCCRTDPQHIRAMKNAMMRSR